MDKQRATYAFSRNLLHRSLAAGECSSTLEKLLAADENSTNNKGQPNIGDIVAITKDPSFGKTSSIELRQMSYCAHCSN